MVQINPKHAAKTEIPVPSHMRYGRRHKLITFITYIILPITFGFGKFQSLHMQSINTNGHIGSMYYTMYPWIQEKRFVIIFL